MFHLIRTLITLALLACFSAPAAAQLRAVEQDEPEGSSGGMVAAEPADQMEEEYTDYDLVPYDFFDYGFFIELPEGGSLFTPESPDWDYDEKYVMVWEDDLASIARVEVMSLYIDGPVDEEKMLAFTNKISESMTADPNVTSEGTERNVVIGLYEWDLLQSRHDTNGDGSVIVHSLICATHVGQEIYSLNLYTTSGPFEGEMRDYAEYMIGGFYLADDLGIDDNGMMAYFSDAVGMEISLPYWGTFEDLADENGNPNESQILCIWSDDAASSNPYAVLISASATGDVTNEDYMREYSHGFQAGLLGYDDPDDISPDIAVRSIGGRTWHHTLAETMDDDGGMFKQAVFHTGHNGWAITIDFLYDGDFADVQSKAETVLASFAGF